MAEIKLLNSNQKKAVLHDKGPLLIIAGAGTGKTTVVTERIKNLILNKNINPNNILALTFTDKASFEMQERIDKLMPYGYTNMWIHTFHSFCDRILKDEAHSIGLNPNYKLISETESIFLLTQNIFNLELNLFKPKGNPTKFLDALLKHFSRLKDEDITPKEYIKWANKNKNKIEYIELANAYMNYENLKIKNSFMDFSDLISNTLLLFRERPNILKRYQEHFKFILVDEFQDTNYAQNELAILLAGNEKNLTVVADDDQSIYRFRGAAVSNVLQFKKNFPEAITITLNDNYRSTQTILDSSYRLIQNNNPNRLEVVEKIDKKLISHSSSEQFSIELINEKRNEDEAEKISKTIKKLSKLYDYKDFAILVRANNHAQPIANSLQRNKIPFQFLGPGYLFQQDEIKDLIAYLNFLTNLTDSVSLFRVLSMDIFNISYPQLIYLFNFAKKKNITLYESLSALDQTFLHEDTKEKLNNFFIMTNKHLEFSKKETAGQILYYFLIDTGIFENLQKNDSLKDEKKIHNIAKFFDRIKNFESERNDSNIFITTEWLNLMIDLGDSPTAADLDQRDTNAVNILTVHSSKGLEFKVVFLINLVNDRFPSRERSEKIPLPEGLIKENVLENSDFHLEEERRLFYVGMTRAKERLFFTAADFYGTAKRPKKLSPFIYEALPDLKIKENIKNNFEQLSLTEVLSAYEQKTETNNEKKEPFKVGYITYSNLQMFDICPLHYKAKVIFNIPTPTTFVQSFGISLHNTFYDYFKEFQNDNLLNLDNFLKLLKNEWISDGYLGKKHEEERMKQAEKIIKNFYKSECTPPIKKPIGLEMPFSFNLKNSVKVFGKIDRIDRKKSGIEIIDYKTGQDNPKAESAHKLQLAIYALAATRVKDKVFDNLSPDNITLTLHFVEENKKKSMNFSKDDLDKFEIEILEKINEIENSEFKCSGSIICKTCEFKMLCHA